LGLAVATVAFCAESLAGTTIFDDRHRFHLGYARQDAEAKVTSSVDPLPPIEIDLQDDLNVDNSSASILAAYQWRFAEKWTLGLTYQRLSLDGDGLAARDFNFDGEEYRAGAQVNTEFTMDTYRLDVSYALIRNDQWELMVGLGVHTFVIETALEAQVSLEDGGGDSPLVDEFTKETADVLAPLPNLRAGVAYLITPRWSVTGSVGWLGLNIGDFSGSYTYADVATAYRFTERFGIGASYQIAELDAKIDDSDGFDEVNIKLPGPSIYLVYGF
jgi:hypothetical protein